MISVLLTAYCGEAYIAQQIASILPQLAAGDELLVSDDSPPDLGATREAVAAFADPRIRYLAGPRRGVIKNIEFLLGQARGALLVLSDQDDVWLPGKLEYIRTLDTTKPVLLLHDAHITDEALRDSGVTLFHALGVGPGLVRNLVKNGFTGCCMALTRPLLDHVLPFPEGIPMHDQWLGLQALRRGTVIYLDKPLLLYRRHEGTQTGHGSSLKQKLLWRARMLKALREV